MRPRTSAAHPTQPAATHSFRGYQPTGPISVGGKFGWPYRQGPGLAERPLQRVPRSAVGCVSFFEDNIVDRYTVETTFEHKQMYFLPIHRSRKIIKIYKFCFKRGFQLVCICYFWATSNKIANLVFGAGFPNLSCFPSPILGKTYLVAEKSKRIFTPPV